MSVDTIELHQEWLATSEDNGGVGPLRFPLASDPHGIAAKAYGVWNAEKEICNRGLFVIDPEGKLQYSSVQSMSVGRGIDEVLRVLDALRTGGLCPANWALADGTFDPETMLQAGRILGHYRIQTKLGSGSFATVFSALDLNLERVAALKVLRGSLGNSRDAILQEARQAASLNHPNVCTIYSVEETDGLAIIVMELLDGQPLSNRIASGMAPEEVKPITRQIALAMAAAHDSKLIHGDLKPANIFVSDAGVVKILDFGLARPFLADGLDAQVSSMVTQDGAQEQQSLDVADTQLVENELNENEPPDMDDTQIGSPRKAFSGLTGTPAYMSPEQASGVPNLPASDVFSFGLILFEMLTGDKALEGNKLLPLMNKLRDEELAPDILPKVENRFRDLLSRMLARDASLRPSMAEISRELETKS